MGVVQVVALGGSSQLGPELESGLEADALAEPQLAALKFPVRPGPNVCMYPQWGQPRAQRHLCRRKLIGSNRMFTLLALKLLCPPKDINRVCTIPSLST